MFILNYFPKIYIYYFDIILPYNLIIIYLFIYRNLNNKELFFFIYFFILKLFINKLY